LEIRNRLAEAHGCVTKLFGIAAGEGQKGDGDDDHHPHDHSPFHPKALLKPIRLDRFCGAYGLRACADFPEFAQNHENDSRSRFLRALD
jgi:hypothetical protein